MAGEMRLIDANALELHFRSTKLIEVFPDLKHFKDKKYIRGRRRVF
ncbi:MAG: hypothetical protein ACI3W5_07505 [Faecousia sp.]